jgi:hypothetical protein
MMNQPSSTGPARARSMPVTSQWTNVERWRYQFSGASS